MVLEKIDCEIAGITAATKRERLEARPPAIMFGTYPMRPTAARTRSAVALESMSGALKKREMVAVDTPAASATWSMVVVGNGKETARAGCFFRAVLVRFRIVFAMASRV